MSFIDSCFECVFLNLLCYFKKLWSLLEMWPSLAEVKVTRGKPLKLVGFFIVALSAFAKPLVQQT